MGPQCPFCKEKTSQNNDANTIWLLPCSSWTRRPVCYACCGYTTCMCIVHHAALFPCIPVLGLYNLCGGFCKEGVDLFTDCKLLCITCDYFFGPKQLGLFTIGDGEDVVEEVNPETLGLLHRRFLAERVVRDGKPEDAAKLMRLLHEKAPAQVTMSA